MKSKVFSFRLRPEEIEKLEKLSSEYDLSPQVFVQKIIEVLISGGKVKERQKSEKLIKTVASTLLKQYEDFEMFTQMIADTSSRLASDIGQVSVVFNGKKKRTKQKQTSPKQR